MSHKKLPKDKLFPTDAEHYACAGLSNMANYADTLMRQIIERNRIIYRRRD